MTRFKSTFGPFRLPSVVVFAALVAPAASWAADPDLCIAGESVIGCRTERQLDDVISHGERDIESAGCRTFRDGEPVNLIDQEISSDRRQVRRPGETQSYWVLAKFSRPISECRPTAVPKKRSDDTSPLPKTSPRRVESPAPNTSTPECVVKPVMTDDDIAACRRARH